MSKKNLSLFENPPSASSSEDDENSSEEESDHDQPMEPEPESSPKHRSKKAIAAAPLSKKRQTEGTSSTQVTPKRAKKSGQKSAGSSRVWSEEDEIKLLQHLIDFHSETGSSPFEDKLGFFNFVKNNISFEVKKSQVDDKIRGIKKKYIRNRNYTLGKAHDEKCLHLVKDIWGDDGTDLLTSIKVSTCNGESSGKKVLVEDEVLVGGGQGSRKKLVQEGEGLGHAGGSLASGGGSSDWFDKSVLVKSLTRYGLAEQTVKERWSSFSQETKKELEEKWKELEKKKLDVVSLEFKFMSDLASKFVKAT